MARKRKSTSSAPPPKKRKTSTLATPTDPGEEIQSAFLRLPAELRNEIYGLICTGKGEKAYLTARSRGSLLYRSDLLRVNRQVRDEFTAVLCTMVPTIVAEVKDLDFGHVIRFFNRCDEIELKTLQRAEGVAGAARQLTIDLYLRTNAPLLIDGLRRWINRFARPEKKGTNLGIQYRVFFYQSKSVPHLVTVAIRRMVEGATDARKREVAKAILKAAANYERLKL